MWRSSQALLLAFLLADGVSPRAQEPAEAVAVALPELAPDDLALWEEHLRPTESELAWQSIDWRPSFAAGVLEADAQGKPLLFWAMNGHPLGCT